MIGIRAFEKCSSLSSVTIGNSVTTIENYAFKDCTSLTSIVIPDSVTKIGFAAFSGCSSLITMALPFIGGSATENQFLGYIFGASSYTESENYVPPSIRNVTISNSCSSLSDDAFYGCPFWVFNECDNALYLGNENNPYLVLFRKKTSSFTSCEINENCKFVYSNAFSYCSSLTSITIPNTVTSIGYEAFFNCSSLSSVIISDSVTSIAHGTFSYCSSLSSITIPNSVSRIGYEAFSGCTALESIVIPNSVNRIDFKAFIDCSSLTSVTIPSNVAIIGSETFSNCSSLSTIDYMGTVEQWNAITLGYNWNYKVPATVVHCSDGDVML